MKRQKPNIKKTIKKRIDLKLKSKNNNIAKNETKMSITERDKLRLPNYNHKTIDVQSLSKEERNQLRSNIVTNDEFFLKNEIKNKTIHYNFINDVDTTKLKILFIISNYEREEMLNQLLNEIRNIGADYIIFDDVSSYKINDNNVIINDFHRGKENYWKTFDEMFKYCKDKFYDIYVFTPNDFLKYDMNRIMKYGGNLINEEYVFNIINDGRKTSWNKLEPLVINDEIKLHFFTDCGFFTNYKTLKLLEFKVNQIILKNNKNGSMVGCQLTNRLLSLKVPIFTPIKSIAFHGDHHSLMNYETRIVNKLISR